MNKIFKTIAMGLLISVPLFAATRTAVMKQEEAQTERSVQVRASDPGSPVTNQLWLNSSSYLLKFYDGTIRTLNPASSGGLSNYVTNAGAETDTTGWASYADAAGTSPVDGSGGSPTTTLTRNTSSTLRGNGDFLITKDAADRQGEGVSYAFTIDNADKGKRLELSFDYTSSANFVAGSSADIRVFVYDVTNTTLITPDVSVFPAASGPFRTWFYSSSTSTSYRLIFHIATTNALAYTVNFDNVSLRALVTDPEPLAITIRDERTSGTDGGNPTTGAWTARVINTLINPNFVTWASLSANTLTLSQQGTYKICGDSVFYRPEKVSTKLRNTTDSTDVPYLLSTNGHVGAGNVATVPIPMCGVFSITSSKDFQVHYWVTVDGDGGGRGLGLNNSIGGGLSEIYLNFVVEKLK